MDLESALLMVQRLYARLEKRRPEIRKAEDYYLGKQPLNFATREWQDANAARYSGFSDNWVRPVVDAEAERLRHSGVKMDDKEAASKLWGWWLDNELEAQSSQGFITTLSARRSFVLVWPSSDMSEPVVTWQHPENVEVEYDAETRRTRVAALKVWRDDDEEFATLYEPTALWKFRRKVPKSGAFGEPQALEARLTGSASGQWEPREVRGESWPLRNPLGVVPIVEVPNRPLLMSEPVSEIEGVMPMQDAANLLWAYLFLAADYASMPARVVLHQGPPKMPILDDQGKQIGEKLVDIKDLQEKRLLYLQGKDTAIDSWEAAKLDVFTDTIENCVAHIAAQTRTPPTYLVTRTGMSNVNGEGLKASEIGLVKKCIEFQTFATPAIREVYRLMALATGDQALASIVRRATVSWSNPEIRSESQLADALQKKRSMGYPLEYLLEIEGLDPVEVERVLAMVEAERLDAQVTAAGRALEGVWDGVPGGSLEAQAGAGGDLATRFGDGGNPVESATP